MHAKLRRVPHVIADLSYAQHWKFIAYMHALCNVLKMMTIKTKDDIMHNFIYRDRHTGQMMYVYVIYKQLYQ